MTRGIKIISTLVVELPCVLSSDRLADQSGSASCRYDCWSRGCAARNYSKIWSAALHLITRSQKLVSILILRWLLSLLLKVFKAAVPGIQTRTEEVLQTEMCAMKYVPGYEPSAPQPPPGQGGYGGGYVDPSGNLYPSGNQQGTGWVSLPVDKNADALNHKIRCMGSQSSQSQFFRQLEYCFGQPLL